jgi:hypothetical protein
MSEQTQASAEGQAFMSRLWEYRGTLSTREQQMLDALVAAAGHQQNDVQGYVLFGGAVPFGGTSPFGGTVPYGGGNTFGSGQTFGSGNP